MPFGAPGLYLFIDPAAADIADPQFFKGLKDLLDEKTSIQAFDRSQPGLPLKKGRCGTMTHDYKRCGTTTLFAALNVLDGTIIHNCMDRHRHQEFLKFLRLINNFSK